MTAWQYFKCSPDGGSPEIYRCPANGKRVEDQEIPDVYVLLSDGSWRPNMRHKLITEMCRGWFDQEDDEIAEERMQELYASWKAGTWPGRAFTKVKE